MAGKSILVALLLLSFAFSSASNTAAPSPDQEENAAEEFEQASYYDHEAVDDPRYDPKLNEVLDQFMDLVGRYRVVIVGKKGCIFTEKVKAAFAELKEKPHMIELTTLKPEEEGVVVNGLKRWLGYWTTPQVFVHGMHYGGAELLLENYKNGLLAKDLEEMKTEL